MLVSILFIICGAVLSFPVDAPCETSAFCADLGGFCAAFETCPDYNNPPCHPGKPDVDCVCCPDGTFPPTPRPTRAPTPRPTPWPTTLHPTSFPTPVPTPAAPTPAPTPEDECEPEKLDIVQVVACDLDEGVVLGTYDFKVEVVVQDNTDLAFVVNFDNYLSGSIRSRGSCDNRPNDTTTDFLELFDEINYPGLNSAVGWTKTVIPAGYQSPTNASVFYDLVRFKVTLDLQVLAEDCKTVAGDTVVEIEETAHQKTYSGIMYVHAIEPTAPMMEGERIKFSKECDFSITWKGKKGQTKRAFRVEDVDLEVLWTHSECMMGEHAPTFVVETRVPASLNAVLFAPVSGEFLVTEVTPPTPGQCSGQSEPGVCAQVWEVSSLTHASVLGHVQWKIQNSDVPVVIEVNLGDANPCRDVEHLVQYRTAPHYAQVKRLDARPTRDNHRHKTIKAAVGDCDQYYLKTLRIDECSCGEDDDPRQVCYSPQGDWTPIADFTDAYSMFSDRTLLKTNVRCSGVEMWSWESESRNGLIMLEYCLYKSKEASSLITCSRLISPLF